MKKINISNLDLSIFYEKLDNGLEIFVLPKNNVNNIYTTFSTKYGSNQIEFVPIDGKEMIKVPLGIAHFLEHKLFEQSNGIDPFTFYSERGSDANANTDQHKTTYLFSGPSFVLENLNYLLDYVQSPYFTDENVSKEKGIIEQEIKMYQDSPDTVLYETLISNVFSNHPMKEPIIGDVDSINSITKEQLYTCYNTFYHPSNMFIIVTGNVEPDVIIKEIKNNQMKKEFLKQKEIKLKHYEEEERVSKKEEIKEMNLSVGRASIAYKIKILDKNILYEQCLYLLTLFDIKLGSTSILSEKLIDKKVINNNLDIYFDTTEHYIIITISGVTDKPLILLDNIKEEMENLKIDVKDFERKKKTLLSSLIYMSDNIFDLNHSIMNDIIKYNTFIDNRYDRIKNLNYLEFINLTKKTNLKNYSTLIIKPKELKKSINE